MAKNRMTDTDVADLIIKALNPHINRFAVTGANRRKEADPGLIEIVVIPYRGTAFGLFKNSFERQFGCEFEEDIARIRLQGREIVLYLACPENFIAKLFLTTGPKRFLDAIRLQMRKNDLRINPAGVRKGGYFVRINDEAQIFELLRMAYIKPNKRWEYGKNQLAESSRGEIFGTGSQDGQDG